MLNKKIKLFFQFLQMVSNETHHSPTSDLSDSFFTTCVTPEASTISMQIWNKNKERNERKTALNLQKK